VAAEWFELLEIVGRTVAKAAMLTMPAGIAELGLELLEDPSTEVARNSDNLVWDCGGDRHHCFFLLNSHYVLLGFWAIFGAMTPSMISTIEIWISWIMILNFRMSSSSLRETPSCTWSVILVELW
jgi:hypothetical protein